MSSIKKLPIYLAFNGLQLAVGLLSIPLITHLLSPSEYGKVGLFMSAAAIFIPLVSLSIETYFPVALAKDKDFDKIKNTMYISVLILFFISLLLLSTLVAFDVVGVIFILLPFFALLRCLRAGEQSILVYKGNASLFGATNVALTFGAFLFSAIMLLYIANDAVSRVLGMVTAELLVFSFFIFKFKFRLVLKDFDLRILKGIVIFYIPLFLSIIPAWFVNEYGRVFLSKYSTLHEVGLLTLSLQLATVQLLLSASVSNAFLKQVYDRVEQAFKYKLNATVISVQATLTLSGYFCINLISDIIISTEYSNVLDTLHIFFLGVFFQSIAVIPVHYASYHGKTHWRLISLTLAAVVNALGLFFLFDNEDPIQAIANLYMFSMMIYAVTMYVFLFISKSSYAKTLPVH
ncbi:lipopolysaccharide biosynthesis protein [Motilimonas cestriensis]|uniref:lipopolysaccharide biosynthesis protein n=1 Tax=Motilimonas cestriensis TaxID=2742685 RepID=UPI003DA667A5